MPIPGTKYRNHLEDNLAAVEIELNEVQMRMLDTALASENVSGQRCTDWVMETIDR